MLQKILGKKGPSFIYYGDYDDEFAVFSSVAVLYPELKFYHSFDKKFRNNDKKSTVSVYRDFDEITADYPETTIENEPLQHWIHAQR